MSSREDLISTLSFSKYISVLECDDKKKKKRALDDLKAALDADETETYNDKVIVIYKQVLRCFSDSSESCRELAVIIISDILNKIHNENDTYFPFILPVMVQRLGNPEIVETSEEVRLLLVELCHNIIKKFSKCIQFYVEEIVQILLKTLNDPHPKIKKKSCECIADLSQAVPRQLFSYTAVILKPTMENFKHQHSRVRVSAIEAVGEVLMRGDSHAMEPMLVPIAERLFDQAPSVRSAAIRVVGGWMLRMPDRYSFFARFIPLLLTGLHDTVPEIRELSGSLWESIGNQYLQENKDDLKDKIDFPLDPDMHYYSSGGSRPSLGCRSLASRFLHWFVPTLAAELRDWRADVRLRAAQLLLSLAQLAEAHATHYVPALADALSSACEDEDARVAHAAQLASEALGAFVPGSAWVPLLLPSKDDPAPTRGRLLLLAALVRGAAPARLLPFLPRLARRLCAGDVRDAVAGPRRHAALLCCEALLTAALAADGRPWAEEVDGEADDERSCKDVAEDSAENLEEDATKESLEDTTEDLIKVEEVTENETNNSVKEPKDSSENSVIDPAKNVEERPGEDTTDGSSEVSARDSAGDSGHCSPDGSADDAHDDAVEGQWVLDALEPLLFRALLTLQAMAEDDDSTAEQAYELLASLADARDGAHALWARRLPPLLRQLRAECRAWSDSNADRRVLESALRSAACDAAAAGALAPALPDVATAVAECAAPGQPPEGATRALTLLAAALDSRSAALRARVRDCAAVLVRDALHPALVWRAGRACEAVRGAAAACLLALLKALAPAPNPRTNAERLLNDEGLPTEPLGNDLAEALASLPPLLASLAEDTSRCVRLFTLRSIPYLLQHAHCLTDDYETTQQICSVFQVVLRRLDDVDDEVRLSALKCVNPIAETLAARGAPSGHVESAFDVLLIHLDDPNAFFRDNVLNTLTRTGRLYPSMLQEKIRTEQSKFRHPQEAESLLRQIEMHCS